MSPAVTATAEPAPPQQVGPHASYIQVAKPYLFQQQLQSRLVALGANQTREDTFRLQGIQWINDVRVGLQLPVRTYSTAVTYYHKFRLVHKDNEYQYADAATAALLTACKIEDTLKKSREVLCAAYNLKVSPSDHLSSDDSTFEGPSKIVIGLERLMLEASAFDFRARYPQKHLLKLAKEAGIERDVVKLAYSVLLDLYRTFAPLKQTCAAMSFACIECATLILEKQQEAIRGEESPRYEKWCTTRAEVMETLLDLLDLYTHFQKSTIVGPSHNIEKFINMRIKLNQEIDEQKSYGRYTEFHEAPKTNGVKTNIKTPKTPITPASPSDLRVNGNGKDGESPATLSPRSAGSGRKGIAGRGQDGTVRFMLDAEQAKQEKETVSDYFRVEYEDYEVEVEEPIKIERNERGYERGHERGHDRGHERGPRDQRNGRDDRFHNKRIRR